MSKQALTQSVIFLPLDFYACFPSLSFPAVPLSVGLPRTSTGEANSQPFEECRPTYYAQAVVHLTTYGLVQFWTMPPSPSNQSEILRPQTMQQQGSFLALTRWARAYDTKSPLPIGSSDLRFSSCAFSTVAVSTALDTTNGVSTSIFVAPLLEEGSFGVDTPRETQSVQYVHQFVARSHHEVIVVD